MGVVVEPRINQFPHPVDGLPSNDPVEPPWIVLRRATRAVHPTQRVPLASLAVAFAPTGDDAHAQARLDLAEALMCSGEHQDSAAMASEVADQASRPDLRLRANAVLTFARNSMTGAADHLAPLDLDTLLSQFPAPQPAELLDDLGIALADYAIAEMQGGHVRRAERTAQAAMRVSQHDRVRVAAGMVRAHAALFDGQLDDALQISETFMTVLHESSTQYEIIAYGPWTAHIQVLTAAGYFDRAMVAGASGQTAAALVGYGWIEAGRIAVQLASLVESGHWPDLLTLAANPVLARHRTYAGLVHGCVALTLARTGDGAGADSTLRAGKAFDSTIHCGSQYLLWAEAVQAGLRCDNRAALQAFRRLAQQAETCNVSVGSPSLIFDAARTEWNVGDRDSASWWLNTLPRSSTSAYAMAFEQAAAALVTNDFGALEAAADTVAADAPFETAKLCVDAARAAHKVGERTIARRLSGRAMKMMTRLGAAGEFHALERELQAAGLVPSVPRVIAGVGAGELTSAERRVADMVRRGHSNKHIASHLGVSIRTVETHLSRVYAKVGVGSRLQLATMRDQS
jgi:DNA-binding CsgD family transcriptional regulator